MRFPCFLLLLLVCFINPALARTNEKLWADLNITGPLNDGKTWFYNLRNSSRFINQDHGVELAQFSAELGHSLRNNLTAWFGYQWNTPNLVTDTPQQNRLWQQLTWDALRDSNMMLSSRTRLEERFREGDPGTAVRVRQRATLRISRPITRRMYPLFWEEIFINLNRVPWVTSGTIDENRFFVGVAITHSQHVFELGYLNQYSLSRNQNSMSNVLYMGLTVRT